MCSLCSHSQFPASAHSAGSRLLAPSQANLLNIIAGLCNRLQSNRAFFLLNFLFFLKRKLKEVIRPQVPLRTPCYNLARLAERGIVFFFRKLLIRTSLNWLDGRCVQSSGTYSPRFNEARLLGIPVIHEGELQPSIRTEAKFRGLPYPFGLGTHCLSHCMPRVAQGIRAIQIYRCPLLPQCCHCSFHRVLCQKWRIATMDVGLARYLS